MEVDGYDEVQAAGMFLLRGTPEVAKERFPSLVSEARSAPPTGHEPDASPDAPATVSGLPVRHPADPARAARGGALLDRGSLGGGLVPMLALRNLWIPWGTAPPDSDAAYWAQFAQRYGFAEALPGRGGLPSGVRAAGASATFDCRMCHVGMVAGRVIEGVGNSELDLQGLFDDLVRLNALAPMFDFPSVPLPFALTERTGAAGATDAFGLGMEFSTRYGPPGAGVATRYGYRQPAPWWTLRYRDRIYADGSGCADGHRTMMAMLLAFGMSFAELQARDADMADLAHHLRGLLAPAWPFGALDPAARARGRVHFQARCAGCHGVYDGIGASFPDRLVPVAEVGTDPLRATRFGAAEAAWVNASWFGADRPMVATGAYLAPPLVGVWATAPYFHNGSVPDLAGVLDPARRPARWRRLGHDAAHYDPDRVGWRHEAVAAAGDPRTLEGRRVYDTTREGLRNGGHAYGADLPVAARSDLLAYLRGL